MCFYRVVETWVEVWENEKCCGNTSCRRVFPQLFRVLPNFHEFRTVRTVFQTPVQWKPFMFTSWQHKDKDVMLKIQLITGYVFYFIINMHVLIRKFHFSQLRNLALLKLQNSSFLIKSGGKSRRSQMQDKTHLNHVWYAKKTLVYNNRYITTCSHHHIEHQQFFRG